VREDVGEELSHTPSASSSSNHETRHGTAAEAAELPPPPLPLLPSPLPLLPSPLPLLPSLLPPPPPPPSALPPPLLLLGGEAGMEAGVGAIRVACATPC